MNLVDCWKGVVGYLDFFLYILSQVPLFSLLIRIRIYTDFLQGCSVNNIPL